VVEIIEIAAFRHEPAAPFLAGLVALHRDGDPAEIRQRRLGLEYAPPPAGAFPSCLRIAY
jgi:hypothetical protein